MVIRLIIPAAIAPALVLAMSAVLPSSTRRAEVLTATEREGRWNIPNR